MAKPTRNSVGPVEIATLKPEVISIESFTPVVTVTTRAIVTAEAAFVPATVIATGDRGGRHQAGSSECHQANQDGICQALGHGTFLLNGERKTAAIRSNLALAGMPVIYTDV